MKIKIITLPAIIFFLVIISFFYLLIVDRNPSELPSVLINKKVPTFEAKSLFTNKPFTSKSIFGNEIVIVNFFATWCKPCIDEHPYIESLSDELGLKVIGINYKDNSEKATKWLKKMGNPYSKVFSDKDGNIGIDWGVYGLPETFIINSKSIIKYRLVGPINKNNFNNFVSMINRSNEE